MKGNNYAMHMRDSVPNFFLEISRDTTDYFPKKASYNASSKNTSTMFMNETFIVRHSQDTINHFRHTTIQS